MEEGKQRPHYEVGDIVKLKKPHPCGSSEWEILRVGADFRLKCQGCGHQIMIARRLVEKKYPGTEKKGLKSAVSYGKVKLCDVLFSLLFPAGRGQRP